MLHIVGIVGVPGRYGGFETLADRLLDSSISSRLGGITVYCESWITREYGFKYKGADLAPIPLRANGWQSVLFDSVGLWKASFKGGVVLVLGTSATFWLPILRRFFPKVRYIVNMAGLEWAREKWGFLAKRLLKNNEAAAARYAHVFIADNQGLVDYIYKTYGRTADLIAYGGDQFRNIQADIEAIECLELPADYDFAMARAQIDNNMEMILDAYATSGLSLVFVSNWDSIPYGVLLKKKYSVFPNIYMVGPFYDLSKIKAIHQRARLYVHGHSAGGTNPSLVEAMWVGLPTLAFDVSFNRYTTHEQAFYFATSSQLNTLSTTISSGDLLTCGNDLQRIAEREYTWVKVRKAYEKVLMTEE